MNLVNSISATERIKLWDKFCIPVDHDKVKLEFFRRVHAKNPPFRIKVQHQSRSRAVIPSIIKYHYEKPPSLLPSLRDIYRYRSVVERNQSEDDIIINDEYIIKKIIDTEISTFNIANKKISDFCSEIGNNDLFEDPFKNCANGNESNNKTKPRCKVTKTMTKGQSLRSKCAKTKADSKNNSSSEESLDDESAKTDGNNKSMSKDLIIESELRFLDVQLIKLLAFQRLQQIIDDNPDLVMQYQSRGIAKQIREIIHTHSTNSKTVLPSELLSQEDIVRISRMFTEEHVSSEEEVSKIFEKPKRKITDIEKAQEIAVRLEPIIKKSLKQIRALLTPLNDLLENNGWFTDFNLDTCIKMTSRTLNIGCGHSVDLCLRDFGNCLNISSKHATIFYDDMSQEFELLNYSEYGTKVNGQLYSCNTEPLTLPKIVKKDEIVNKGHIIYMESAKKPQLEKLSSCRCILEQNLLASGWEGTAVLNHGTLIKFGCISFVFSITYLEDF